MMTDILANWPAPTHIGALTTTRMNGNSQLCYAENNLALHVGDVEKNVLSNRQALINRLQLPAEPAWLNQTHSNICINIDKTLERTADAAVTRSPSQPLVIMTADCLPVLLCDESGEEIAAIHCGWRGLAAGIIEKTLNEMRTHPHRLMAWLGPAICARCFEIGPEVKELFVTKYPNTEQSFQQKGLRWLGNLAKMAELILNAQGINNVYHASACTFELEHLFYSYRRASQTGRMATLIWFK